VFVGFFPGNLSKISFNLTLAKKEKMGAGFFSGIVPANPYFLPVF
jgi:hypothetical protein